MKIIPQIHPDVHPISDAISSFLKRYRLGALLKSCNAYKSKGFAVIVVFEYLLGLIFSNRSMYMNLLTKNYCPGFSKDTAYRLLNSASINWQKFTTLLAGQVTNQSIVNLTDAARDNVFIIDDTLYERNRSKKVELLSKVYDHARNRYCKGFRLLTLGWSDGNTFVPVSGSLLASENKKNQYSGSAPDLDKRSLAFKRRQQAQRKATEVMMDLIDLALTSGLKASYVLFDTWFCSPSSLIAIKDKDIDVIAMAKKSSKVLYLFEGKRRSAMDIYRMCKKRRGRSKYLLSVEVSVQKDERTLPVRLVFVRNHNKPKDYLVLISTNVTLSESEVIRIYGKRWDIEVFFKVCKSYLNLSGSFKGLSYDAQTAHVAIVFTRYTLLSIEQRFNTDDRSIGELFYLVCDELADISFDHSYAILMDAFIAAIGEEFGLSQPQVMDFMERFILTLPKMLQISLKTCA
jgi:hypothetical protein